MWSARIVFIGSRDQQLDPSCLCQQAAWLVSSNKEKWFGALLKKRKEKKQPVITRFQAPNVYVINFMILKEEKNPLWPDCPGPRLGQSGHCVGELEEEIRNKSGQGDRFSLAQIGIISAGYIVRSGSEVLPYYSVTHSSSSSLP